MTARIDSYNTNGVVFEFIGGEPFLEIELIDQITDYLVSEMIRLNHPWATKHIFSISTNGILYFDPRVQEYIKKHFWNLSLSISIDGNK
jgi:sulfatase maturation enzyme AslB (radical SAM superfamily)